MMIAPLTGLRQRTAFAGIAVSVAALCLAAPAAAQEGPLGPVLECADIQDNAQRLACYDERVGALRTSVQTGEIVAVDRPAVEAIERDGFGLSLPSLPRLTLGLFSGGSGSAATASTAAERGISTAENTSGVEIVERGDDGQIERVLMTIARVDSISPNQYRFTMDNGQVWVQVESGRALSTRNLPGSQAEIRRAAMGSFLLRIDGRGQAIRVNRAQ